MDAWYKSMVRFFRKERPMHQFIYGKGMLMPKDNKATYKQTFLEQRKAVFEHFNGRPCDLLRLKVDESAFNPLTRFLGKGLPKKGTVFPHANGAGRDVNLVRVVGALPAKEVSDLETIRALLKNHTDHGGNLSTPVRNVWLEDTPEAQRMRDAFLTCRRIQGTGKIRKRQAKAKAKASSQHTTSTRSFP